MQLFYTWFSPYSPVGGQVRHLWPVVREGFEREQVPLYLVYILFTPYLHQECPSLHQVYTLFAPCLHLIYTLFAPYLHLIYTVFTPWRHLWLVVREGCEREQVPLHLVTPYSNLVYTQFTP